MCLRNRWLVGISLLETYDAFAADKTQNNSFSNFLTASVDVFLSVTFVLDRVGSGSCLIRSTTKSENAKVDSKMSEKGCSVEKDDSSSKENVRKPKPEKRSVVAFLTSCSKKFLHRSLSNKD